MTGYVDPTSEQFKAFMSVDEPGAIWMLNLVRFRAIAAYGDGRIATGAEAYRTYSVASAPFFLAVGGRILWSGDPKVVLIGPENERWDTAFVAEYPGAKAFGSMVTNPDYQSILYHRKAAVEDSRLIRLAPAAIGNLFG